MTLLVRRYETFTNPCRFSVEGCGLWAYAKFYTLGGAKGGVKRRNRNNTKVIARMKKKVLMFVSFLLAAVLLLPAGAWAQAPTKKKVRVTAEVFDSYDITFVRDRYGMTTGVRGHEKGGQLWVKVDDGKSDGFIPAAAFDQKVEVGQKLIFKVKLAENYMGDQGEMLGFEKTSEWWEVNEWRVNGEVLEVNKAGTMQPNQNLVFKKEVTTDAEDLHVGVRFQRKQFLAKVVYHNSRESEANLTINSNWFSRDKDYPYSRKDKVSISNESSYDITNFIVNGVSLGKHKSSEKNIFSYSMEEGDLWIEASFSRAVTSRRYIKTACTGDGEWERFQVNTVPIYGPSAFPIRGVVEARAAKKGLRPYGIRPDDLCKLNYIYKITVEPKKKTVDLQRF